jgi:hypothetical protein
MWRDVGQAWSRAELSTTLFGDATPRAPLQQAIKELLPKMGIVCVAPPTERTEVLCKPKLLPIKVWRRARACEGSMLDGSMVWAVAVTGHMRVVSLPRSHHHHPQPRRARRSGSCRRWNAS